MKILIVGYGSIAKKHVHALRSIGQDFKIFAWRSNRACEEIEGITNVFDLNDVDEIDFILISNPTSLHADALKAVLKFKKPIFLEKPPFHTLDETDALIAEIERNNILTYTAFNLRFLDALIYIKDKFNFDQINEVNIYCGSYLPDWRKNEDYTKSYSADHNMGGGVHLDLIHEMDYALWIFGKPIEITSMKKKLSTLDIHSFDYAHYILVYDGFVVNISLNYFRRDAKRSMEIVCNDNTIEVDLMKNVVVDVTNNIKLFDSTQTVSDTYEAQMNYFLECMKMNITTFNTIANAADTLKYALS